MRLLTYNIQSSLLDLIESTNLYLCDHAEDFYDALYHSQVRFYNLIIIKESVKNLKEILYDVNAKDTAVIVMLDCYDKKHEIELLKKGAICVLKQTDDLEYIMAKIQSIHRENFLEHIYFKNDYVLNVEEQSIKDRQNNKLVIKGKKSFSILTYLVKKRDMAPISKDELLNVIWDEPEMVNDNVIEVNINTIRNNLRKTFNQDFIETVRHRGYRVKV